MREEDKEILFGTLLKKIFWILDTPYAREERMQAVCEILKSAVGTYNWIGFYMVDPQSDKELVLGPFAGVETEHARIKFGQGICGQTAETLKTFIVNDISKESNYLSCSLYVKSEIVLPIFLRGSFIGELDIDSHTTAAFTQKDEEFLKVVCEMISNLYVNEQDHMKGDQHE